jgi:hypothetical protein
MTITTRALALLRRRILGHPCYIWLLWAVAALVLIACPAMLADPAMWPYLLDPELLILIVVIGIQCTRLECGVTWLRIRTTLARWTHRSASQEDPGRLDG